MGNVHKITGGKQLSSGRWLVLPHSEKKGK